MNEINFINLKDIGSYKVRFKCFVDGRDGYQAAFHVYDKLNSEIHYQIDFEMSGTGYNSKIFNSGKPVSVYINENYGNVENCFKEIGYKFIEEKIKQDNIKNEKVNIIPFLNKF